MMTLVLTVCLVGAQPAADPAACREEPIAIDAPTPMQCLMLGTFAAANWQEAHPKWRVTGWRCTDGRRREWRI